MICYYSLRVTTLKWSESSDSKKHFGVNIIHDVFKYDQVTATTEHPFI